MYKNGLARRMANAKSEISRPDNVLLCFKRKIRTHQDLLSIPQSGGGEMSKRLGGIKGSKYKTSLWHLKGFPHGSKIGSTV